jgi:alpha-mannosidase
VDEEGLEIPFQMVRPSATVSSGRTRIVFVADLPAFGWRAFFLRGGKTPPTLRLDAGHSRLDNGVLRVEFDAATGGVRLRDLRSQTDLLAAPAAVGTIVDDPSDTWSHGVVRFDREIGTFKPTRIRLLENGPVRATVRVQSAWGASTLTQDVTLYRDLDAVFVNATVDWRERRKMLKLRFPTALTEPRVTAGIPFGFVERPADGVEHVAQDWLDVSGSEGGLALLTPTKGSYDARGGDLGLTVLRSPIYAHHDPYEPKEDEDYDYTDQGIQRFRYALVPHAGDPNAASVTRRAAAFARPPIALVTSRHPGTLPRSSSHASVEPPNVVITTLKNAEDGDGFIARARETTGRRTEAGFRLLGCRFEAAFGPFEIKTFRLTADGGATETDLLEDPL